MNKKAITAVVSIVLLLAGVVLAFMAYNSWYNTFISDTITTYTEPIPGENIDFLSLNSTTLSIRSFLPTNISYNDIKIDNVTCGVSGNLSRETLNNINVFSCVRNMESGRKEVVVYSNSGTFFENLVLDLSEGLAASNLTVVFRSSTTTCNLGETKIYAMNSINNTHAEIPSLSNYNYVVCLSHNLYTLGTSCSGDYLSLFSLSNTTKAHPHISNSSVRAGLNPSYYNWQNICVSATGSPSTMDMQFSNSTPGSGYECVGSVRGGDYRGRHIGDCSAYNERIWVQIE